LHLDEPNATGFANRDVPTLSERLNQLNEKVSMVILAILETGDKDLRLFGVGQITRKLKFQ
jgi:hypothetical protein